MSDQEQPPLSAFQGLDEADAQELASPLPISRLAFLAPIIGLLSGLACFHHVLLVLPMLGIIIALMALRRTSPPDAIFVGRRAAVAGLTLSLFFGALATSKLYLERYLVCQQAVQFSEDWVNIIRSGNLPQAAEWMRSPGLRRDPDSDLATYYDRDDEAHQLLNTLLNSQVVQQIQELGPADPSQPPRMRLKKIDQYQRFSDFYLITVRLEQLPSDPESLPIICRLKRRQRHGEPRWTVSDLDENPNRE